MVEKLSWIFTTTAPQSFLDLTISIADNSIVTKDLKPLNLSTSISHHTPTHPMVPLILDWVGQIYLSRPNTPTDKRPFLHRLEVRGCKQKPFVHSFEEFSLL
jgi:hypothetical protein